MLDRVRWRNADRRIRQITQLLDRIGPTERREDQELPPFGMLGALDQRPMCRRLDANEARARGSGRGEAKDQSENGDEYAAYRDDPKDRQHPRCISDSRETPNQIALVLSLRRTHGESATGNGRNR